MLAGSANHTTNSGSTSAKWERGLGGRTAVARPRAAAGRPSPRGRSPPRPRGATMGVAGCLRGWPRPRLGGGDSSSTWRAFPFSAAENLFGGAMKKEEKRDGMDRKGRRLPVLIARGGQPPASMITCTHDPLCMQGLVSLCSCRGVMGKRSRPRPINRHATPKAAGYWGPWRIALEPSLLC